MNYIIFFMVFGACCLNLCPALFAQHSVDSTEKMRSERNNASLTGKITVANQKKLDATAHKIQEQKQGSFALDINLPDVSDCKEFMGCSFEKSFDKAMIGVQSDNLVYSNFLIQTPQKNAVNDIRELYNKFVENLENTYREQPRIPKIIHQIWIGPHEFPQVALEWQKTWQEMHPDWEYKLWTNKDIDAFGMANIDSFNQAQNWGEKADIWRYEILYRYGGVYVDIDEKCIKSFDALHHTCDFYIAVHNLLLMLHHNNKFRINNAVFGACPNHPILGKAVEQIKFNRKKDHLLERTGPDFITKVIVNYLSSQANADFVNVILPANYFYPAAERPNKRVKINPKAHIYIMPETLAVHYYTSYWLTPPRKKKTAGSYKLSDNALKKHRANSQPVVKTILTDAELKQFSDSSFKENVHGAMHSIESEWEKYDAVLQKASDKTFFEVIKNHYKEYNAHIESLYSLQPKIPKIIHQIWVGDRPFPQEARVWQESWKKLHPDWDYKLWTNEEVEDLSFDNKKFYNAAKNWAEKADILRYEILYRYGGLCIDIDQYCIMPFDILHHTCDFYAGLQQLSLGNQNMHKVRVNNAVIGSIPGHPILQQAVERIKKTRAHEDSMLRTGPDFFSKVIASKCNASSQEGNVDVVLPASYFYTSMDERNGHTIKAGTACKVTPETMAIKCSSGYLEDVPYRKYQLQNGVKYSSLPIF